MQKGVGTERERAIRRIRFNLVVYVLGLALGLVAWLALAAAGVSISDLPRNAAIYVAVWTLVEGLLVYTSVIQLRQPSERKIEQEMEHLA